MKDVKRTWIVKKEQAEQVRDDAHRRNLTQSSVIRDAIDRYYEGREAK